MSLAVTKLVNSLAFLLMLLLMNVDDVTAQSTATFTDNDADY